jgi:hypothetical protein
VLQQALQGAQVVIVVIGRRWLAASGLSSSNRLHHSEDYVRIEVEMALSQQLPVIPVLVEGASMPAASDLPESIRPLAFHQAHEMSDSRWTYDADRLSALVERHGIAPRAQIPLSRSSVADLVRGAAAAVAQVPADFFSLLSEPRRFLAMRGTGTYRDVIRGVVFLCVSQILGAVLILQEWPTRSGFIDFVMTAPVLALIVALVVSMPMYFAWRLVGAPREYQRLLVILVYQCSFAGLALSLAVLTMLIGIKMVAPDAVDRVAQSPTPNEVLRLLSALQTAPEPRPWFAASLVMVVIGLATCIWFVGAWRSYGIVLDRTGLRSLIAFVLFVLLLSVPLGLVILAATLV